MARAPKASPGTAATSASSRITVASSVEVVTFRPRISRPRAPETSGKT